MNKPLGPWLPSYIFQVRLCPVQNVSSSPDTGGEKERELAVTELLPHSPLQKLCLCGQSLQYPFKEVSEKETEA